MGGGARPGSVGLAQVPVVDAGTGCVNESYGPGTIGAQGRPAHRDELTPIADYIAAEMNRNAHGDDVRRMAQMNAFSSTDCITDFTNLPLWKQLLGLGIRPEQCVDMQMSYNTAALLAWAAKVRQDGDWDHKPKIAARFRSCTSTGAGYWHLYGSTLYYYDVWSNVHYGYVGRAAGFSTSTLLDGAGLEQIGSNLARLNWPSRTPGVPGLRAFDDAHDRSSVGVGIDLYAANPRAVASSEVLAAVLAARDILKKPYSP